MRVARIVVEGEELAALEHGGHLHRVDLLDAILGVPWAPGAPTDAVSFQRRVLSLGPATLESNVEALEDGTRLDDTRVETPTLLPPVGLHAQALELAREGHHAHRINARTLRGHGATILAPASLGPLVVAPALAVILREDLHVPAGDEALASVLGVTLALAWSALAEGAHGREIGTHLGPWVRVGELSGEAVSATLAVGARAPFGLGLTLEPRRVARALVWAARYGDLHAGDVLVVPAPVLHEVELGEPITLSTEHLGALRGTVGG